MPELPEVETTRRGIEPHLLGRTVAAVTVRQPKLRWPVPPDTFAWLSNTGTYLLIGAMLVVELALRAWLLPHDRFRNQLRFLREARTRLPDILRELRHG